MIRMIALVLVAVLTFAGGFASADEGSQLADGQVVAEGTTSLASGEVADPTAHVYWHFITCVHDDHECLHEAEHHGYEHYKAVHDSRSCHGHEHYACYGGHH